MAVAAEASAARSLDLILIAALVSFNLGIFNLLPLPALDGFHLGCFALEAVRGKPLKENVLKAISNAGLVALMGLLVVLVAMDTLRLLEG